MVWNHGENSTACPPECHHDLLLKESETFRSMNALTKHQSLRLGVSPR